MKKLIMLLLAMILLCGATWQDIDWYDYVGKKVMIVTDFNIVYTGVVEGIVQVDQCIAKDQYGNCNWSIFYYTMLLRDDHAQTVVLRCESIHRIAEIN
jgi:hypothetical protein